MLPIDSDVTEQTLKQYASDDTPKSRSIAQRGLLVCTFHRQPYFFLFDRGEEIPCYVNQDFTKQNTVVSLFKLYEQQDFQHLVDELLRAAREANETTARLAVSVCSGSTKRHARATEDRPST